MNEPETITQTRRAATHGLAIVGFVILVGAGIWLAVYSTRYVPTVVNRMGAAAVYLGSVFTPSTASLSVVPTPTASSTISSSTTGSVVDTTTTVAEPAASTQTPPATTAGEKTNTTEQISGTTVGRLSGLPDFITTISAVGYLTTTSADSFIASSSVLAGARPAVKFSIKNIGTNVSGLWCFSATIPTQSSYLYQSQPQQSLNPGDRIDYTLGFDQAYRGVDQMISVTANIANTANTATCARAVIESSADNNSASAKLTILGG